LLTLLGLKGNIPSFIATTASKVHEVNILDDLISEASAIDIMDRGYLELKRLYSLINGLPFLIDRAKTNTRLRRPYSAPVDKNLQAYDAIKSLCQ
jgi:hypothetical protein